MTEEAMPKQPHPWRLFTAFNAPGPRWPGALRSATSLAIPGILALSLGYGSHLLLIAAGCFTVIYGEGHPYRTRWRVMLTAGLLIALGAFGGAFAGSLALPRIAEGASHWWLLVPAMFTVLAATVGAFVQNALRLPPPGSFFIVMVAGGSTMTARLGIDPIEVAGWSLLGVCSGMVCGMVPYFYAPHSPEKQAVRTLDKAVADFAAAPLPAVAKNHQAESALQSAWWALADAGIISGGRVVRPQHRDLVHRTVAAQHKLAMLSKAARQGDDATIQEIQQRISDSPLDIDLERSAIPHSRPTVLYRIYRSLSLYSHATMTALRVFVATTLAGVVGIALGLGRPDWAIVSALLVLQWGPDRIPGTIRGVHRFVGSIAGVGLYALIDVINLGPWFILGALVICQFFAEVFVVRNYAFCVIFTTPLALLMGGSTENPLPEVVGDRIAEVVLATVFSMALLWVFIPNAEPRHHQRLVHRSYAAMGTLLGSLLTMSPREAIAQRRDLQYELLAERRAAQSLAVNNPDVAARQWSQHLDIQHAGYNILDECTRLNNREFTMEEIMEMAREVRSTAR